jgi:hypothetical protein
LAVVRSGKRRREIAPVAAAHMQPAAPPMRWQSPPLPQKKEKPRSCPRGQREKFMRGTYPHLHRGQIEAPNDPTNTCSQIVADL